MGASGGYFTPRLGEVWRGFHSTLTATCLQFAIDKRARQLQVLWVFLRGDRLDKGALAAVTFHSEIKQKARQLQALWVFLRGDRLCKREPAAAGLPLRVQLFCRVSKV